MEKKLTVDELYTFCKKKGFVFKSSDLYGGLAGFYDYGFLGVELKNNILKDWWNTFVRRRKDIIGIDGSIISKKEVWDASGHTKNFNDPLVQDLKTKKYYRADHLIEDKLNIIVDGKTIEELQKIIDENNLTSPEGNPISKIKVFNLMFPVNIGAEGNTIGFLRGETAQSIFVNFKNVVDTGRVKLPFGIAQVGKAFRNEISPREFLFRQREFLQMEIEYFYNPNYDLDEEYYENNVFLDFEFYFLSSEMQEKNEKEKKVKLKELLEQKKLSKIHAFWLYKSLKWYLKFLKEENLRVREHLKEELSHYSTATFDIEYNFPFGFKEIFGIADRGNYDLTQHQKFSGKKLEILDDKTGEKIIPNVIEPSFGFDRFFMALILDSYFYDEERKNVVLKLHENLSPYKVAVMPLVSNKKELLDKSLEVYDYILENSDYNVFFDKSGSIGRRYARQDEIGTPYCITIDFDTLNDDTVTIRFRDTKEQKRVKIQSIINEIQAQQKK